MRTDSDFLHKSAPTSAVQKSQRLLNEETEKSKFPSQRAPLDGSISPCYAVRTARISHRRNPQHVDGTGTQVFMRYHDFRRTFGWR